MRYLLLLLIGTSFAQENWELLKFNQARKITDQKLIRIINHYGDVRTRALQTDDMQLIGNIQRIKSDPLKVDIRVREDGDTLIVEVVYVGDDRPPADGEKWIRRVDLTVLMPAYPGVDIEGKHGLVEVKGHEGPLKIVTERGDVVFAVRGPVEIQSQQGALKGQLTGTHWKTDQKLSSLLGAIEVMLNSEADLKIETSTKGRLTSDFTMDVNWVGRERLKHSLIVLGQAEPRLHIHSNRGDVSVLRIDP